MTAKTLQELREAVARKLAANPSIKTAMLAETLGVAEVDVLRAMPEGVAQELDATRSEHIIRAIETLGTVYTIVRNAVAIQETKGKFGGFSRSGPFLNVDSDVLHMHLRVDRVAACIAMRMPVGEGEVTNSIQFFDSDGASAMKVFLMESMQREAGEDSAITHARFNDLVSRYAL